MSKAQSTWTVPRMWAGRTVAILASGPSMSQEIANAVRDAHLPCIAINTTYQLAPFADMLYAADTEWWEFYKGVPEFRGLKVCCQHTLLGIQVIKHTGTHGFEDRPDAIRTGSNSGYQALHIAVHAGAKRVLLFGFDMHGGHWHPDHPTPLRKTLSVTYEKFVANFTALAPLLKDRGVEVLNCTPGSLLACFEFCAPGEALTKFGSPSPEIGPVAGFSEGPAGVVAPQGVETL